MKYVGKNVERADVTKKVKGSLQYVCDEALPGMLHLKILRASCAKGKILQIYTGAARSMPGIALVLTAKDFTQPVPRFGPIQADQPLLADGEVRLHGQPVAAVLSEDEALAAKALGKIKVNYEVMPAVTCISEALKPGAPIVDADHADNIFGEYNYQWGEVEKFEGQTACELENEYTFPPVYHYALESFTCLASPMTGGGVEIRTPTQNPFTLRRTVAAALGLDQSKVRVIATNLGGGFGGKGYPKAEPLCAYLALLTGRPVKNQMTMDEGFFAGRRLASTIKIKTGLSEDGRIVYQDILADFMMGAFLDASPRIAAKAAFLACGPYRTPNAKIKARVIYSNTTPGTACRGFGMPQLAWALESQMNEAGHRLGLDTLEIRRRNLPSQGEILIPGDTPVDGNWLESLEKAAALLEWEQKAAPGTGKSIAIGIKNPIPNSISHALVKLHADGSVTIAVGTTEMGQGTKTVLAQFAAEILGIPVELVTVVMGDTLVAPFDLCTAASRSVVTMGNAVVSACRDILSQLKTMAAELGSLDANSVTIEDGVVNFGGRHLKYAGFLLEYYGINMGEVVGRGIFRGKKVPGHPMGGLTDFWELVVTGTEVAVDVETGKLTVLKLVNVSDIGKAVNPLQAEGQEKGGNLMAIGHTVMEQMLYNEVGQLVNGNSLDYRVPTTMDIPLQVKYAFTENGDGPGPFGAKGIGESGCFAVSPAIAGAVYEATGVVIRDLPLTPERVWRALRGKTAPVSAKG